MPSVLTGTATPLQSVHLFGMFVPDLALALQEWANLRAQGIKTPEIAAWQRMPVEGTPVSAANRAKAIYPYVLNVYNDPRFSQVGLGLRGSTIRMQAAFCDAGS